MSVKAGSVSNSNGSGIAVDMDVEFDQVCQVSSKFGPRPPGTLSGPEMTKVRELLVSQENDDGSVRLSKNEKSGVALLFLDNPRKCNALSGKMILELEKIVSDLRKWKEGRGILICGQNNMFCSGADLKLIKSLHESTEGVTLCAFVQQLLTDLRELPLLSAALVQKSALGGGAELASACDFRLMSEGAQFGFVQVNMGITTAFGGGTRLVQCVGRTKALDILASCRRYSAQEAVNLGWASAVVPDGEEGIYAAHSWLEERCKGHPSVVQAIKGVVLGYEQGDLSFALKNELECLGRVWGGPAQKAALNNAKKHTK